MKVKKGESCVADLEERAEIYQRKSFGSKATKSRANLLKQETEEDANPDQPPKNMGMKKNTSHSSLINDQLQQESSALNLA